MEVCLTIALKRDPTGIALHHFKNGEPRDDVEGVEIFNYRLIDCSLDFLFEILLKLIKFPLK